MMHELKNIVTAFRNANASGQQAVLATVVALDGSSYRRPGVRMLLLENGGAYGAVSGGCVEKEVHRQAAEVFATGQAKMMTYDGRFRLGCEGILYILLEPFIPGSDFLEAFQELSEKRVPLRLKSWYHREVGVRPGMGTVLLYGNQQLNLGQATGPDAALDQFEQVLAPCLRLEIYGGEHDAVQLCGLASQAGWEVSVTVAADEKKSKEHFPGAAEFRAVIPEQLEAGQMDRQTAVILMTHSYTKDLKYLLRLGNSAPGYLGILGPASRRERLIGDFLERNPEAPDAIFEVIRGPAGIDIGAETPQEIAISILAEILSVFRATEPIALRDKKGAIHDL